MTDADDRLKALFAQDEPPARDAAFSAAVMAEVVRRRFIVDMALLATATTAGAFVLSRSGLRSRRCWRRSLRDWRRSEPV